MIKNVPIKLTQKITQIVHTLLMNQHQYKNLVLTVMNEPTCKFGSSDNTFSYTKHYFGNEATEYPISKHGIKIY